MKKQMVIAMLATAVMVNGKLLGNIPFNSANLNPATLNSSDVTNINFGGGAADTGKVTQKKQSFLNLFNVQNQPKQSSPVVVPNHTSVSDTQKKLMDTLSGNSTPEKKTKGRTMPQVKIKEVAKIAKNFGGQAQQYLNSVNVDVKAPVQKIQNKVSKVAEIAKNFGGQAQQYLNVEVPSSVVEELIADVAKNDEEKNNN